MENKAKTQTRNLAIHQISLDDLSKKEAEWSNRIAKRAYELYAASGFANGHDLDNWLKAEREIVKRAFCGLEDDEDTFIVTANVACFDSKELNIYVNGTHLIIEGKHARGAEKEERGKLSPIGEARQIYRLIELPGSVVADKARAKLRNCVLELELPKAVMSEQIKVAAA
jgi:HSP20 family molecular chaperone IbpA